MKRIAIISNIPITADNHKATLESLFKHVSIKVVTISEWHGGRIDLHERQRTDAASCDRKAGS